MLGLALLRLILLVLAIFVQINLAQNKDFVCEGIVITVKIGDNMYTLAQEYLLLISDLQKGNGYNSRLSKKGWVPSIGDKICVPFYSECPGIVHVLDNGESLRSLSTKYNVSVIDIQYENKCTSTAIERMWALWKGTTICIPPPKVRKPLCGNYICDGDETCETCSRDCGTCIQYNDAEIWHCGHSQKRIALTFDDGPGPYTGKLLDTLKELDVKATFFPLGLHIAGNEEVLRRIHTEGHIIGAHTFNHPDLHYDYVFGAQLRQEMVSSEIELRRALGFSLLPPYPRYFRAPYASYCGSTLRAAQYPGCSSLQSHVSYLRQMGYRIVNWNVNSKDWAYFNTQPETIYNRLTSNFNSDPDYQKNPTDGMILLQHDTLEGSVEQVANVVDFWNKRGYSFATINECIGYHFDIATLEFNKTLYQYHAGGGTDTLCEEYHEVRATDWVPPKLELASYLENKALILTGSDAPRGASVGLTAVLIWCTAWLMTAQAAIAP
jgi:peptidoglycan/xylan/chitin deacetylase (PgdA/CDA1 family)